MRIINRLVVVLIFAMPTCLILVRWPVVFAIVGGGLCVLALVVMTVQIVFSEPLSQRLAPPVQASATVDGVPVRDVEVMP